MQTGERIPEILGTDQNGKEIKASDFAGKKIILYTYPKDNTSGCSAEACSLRDHYEELKAEGYEVVGVSKDSEASHQKFIEKLNLPFTLISDKETTLLQKLGAWGEKTMCGRKTVGTLRTTYLVGEDGTIEHIFEPKQIKTKIHAEQILDKIKG